MKKHKTEWNDDGRDDDNDEREKWTKKAAENSHRPNVNNLISAKETAFAHGGCGGGNLSIFCVFGICLGACCDKFDWRQSEVREYRYSMRCGHRCIDCSENGRKSKIKLKFTAKDTTSRPLLVCAACNKSLFHPLVALTRSLLCRTFYFLIMKNKLNEFTIFPLIFFITTILICLLTHDVS